MTGGRGQQAGGFDLNSYNDVASRLVELREKHPDASLQPVNPEQPFDVRTIGDQTFIVYTAACYRTADDPRPGIGIAWEIFPGRTPYTKGSELQNAETSAWGRAIVAALAADTRKGVASQEEVRNRRAEREPQGDDSPPAQTDPKPDLRGQIAAVAGRLGMPLDATAELFSTNYQRPIQSGTVEQLRSFLDDLLADEQASKGAAA